MDEEESLSNVHHFAEIFHAGEEARREVNNARAQPSAHAGYGLPEGNKGLLPWSWAERRLRKSHNYWITTVKPGGYPHSIVVWGLWQDGRLLFSTGSESRKARNMAHNPNCLACTERANEAVTVEGVAEIADIASPRKSVRQPVSWPCLAAG